MPLRDRSGAKLAPAHLAALRQVKDELIQRLLAASDPDMKV
ncbi:MAG TPA: hypothetical protein VGR07_03115 [Thermoanaerobaculia bacterium]|jgi:hypothetical protein|nr:hypothetical protein [Thermoanaerobaculia bacterium]